MNSNYLFPMVCKRIIDALPETMDRYGIEELGGFSITPRTPFGTNIQKEQKDG